MPTWLIWVIVILVVLVVLGLIVSMMNKRKTEQKRARADELRTEATTQAGGLTESQRQAEDARAKAELARSEAQRAEEQAAAAQQGHQVEQASYEDKLREADRVDPAVNTRSEDYEPNVWNDESSAGDTSTESTSTAAGSHRSDGTGPDDTTVVPPTAPASGTTTGTTGTADADAESETETRPRTTE
jgi:FtsZ-interacting cell division protein ZipA